jgi:hypothetical protein
MLAADAELDAPGASCGRARRRSDQLADAVDVERDERIVLEDAGAPVGAEEAAGVVAADAEGGLRQVVGAEREELGALGDLARPERGARQLDHRADQIGGLPPVSRTASATASMRP